MCSWNSFARYSQEAVANYTQKKFPCKALPGEDAVMPYIRSCSTEWADAENKSHDEIHYIYIADLTSLGSACSRYLARICRILGDGLAAGAERTALKECSAYAVVLTCILALCC